MFKINKDNAAEKTFDIAINLFMLVIIFVTLFPFWYCLVGSLNDGFDYARGGVNFWPRHFTLSNYWVVLQNNNILGAYKITVLRTVIGTVTHILFTSLFAYGYSRKILKWKKVYMIILMIPMYFGGGLIPTYLLFNELHLINNFLVYIIPGLFSFWHAIIMQSFFRGIPDSLTESAMMDGANEYKIYWSIIMPLSTPVLAAIALFTGVGHWNSYFDSMVFTTSNNLKTIQVFLMEIIRAEEQAAKMAQEFQDMMEENIYLNSETLKLAMMMVVTLPVIAIYPFLQRYFVKGMMIGSLKG